MKYDKKKRVQSRVTSKWAQSTRGTFRRILVSVKLWSSLTYGCPEALGAPL